MLVRYYGRYPESWSVGYFTPIHKGNNDASNPNNYRGITTTNTLGKRFNSLIFVWINFLKNIKLFMIAK